VTRWLTKLQLGFLVGGTAVGGLFAVVPVSLLTTLTLYDVGVALALVASVAGVVRGGRARRLPWLLISLGLGGFLAGELLWSLFEAVGIDPFPSVADVVFLAAYIPLGMGAAALASGGGADRDRFAWLDAGILTAVAGVVVWVTVMEPYASDASLGWWEKAVTLGYPLADILVLGLVLRLLLSRGSQTRAVLLFSAGVVVMLGADLWFAWLELGSGYVDGALLDVVWVVSYVLIGIAALDPSARRSPVFAADAGLRRSRLAVVLVAVLIPQTVLFLALRDLGLLGATVPTVALLGTGLATVLVGLRLWSLLHRARRLESRRGADRLAAIVDQSSDAVLLLSKDGTIGYASPAVTMLWGRDPAGCAGTSLASWLVEADRAGLSRQLASVAVSAEGTSVEMHGRVRTVGGTTRAVEGTIRNLLDHDAVHALVVTLRDVTERQELEAQLRRQAFHDDLTGLANRALFVDRLAHALDRAGRDDQLGLAVLFLDLDDFKAVNDGLGHGAGDELLCRVADRVRRCTRPGDTVARLGGDEFAVLLEDLTSMEEATGVAQRILEMLALPVRVGTTDIAVPASIGVAPRTPGATVEALLRDADIAMYSAKAQGKGRVEVFDDALRDAAERHLAMRVELPAALAAGQFRVVYQPIHGTLDGRLTGFEALARWDHPRRGPVAPADFIPAAEESGFVVELGRWVLRQACAQAAEWNRRSATALTMNVNVSVVQLNQAGFADAVAAVLADVGLDPRLLTLELTESVLADDGRINETLASLRELGVGIAIDDFGTGYSSLAYLRQFPVSSLKIDRSFINQLTAERGDASLVKSILGMAEALGLKTVAEGVETDAQLTALRQLDCNLVQGYFLGRPQDAEDLDAVVDASSSAALPGAPHAR